MAEPTTRHSPLAGAADRLARVTDAAGGAIAMAEVPFLTQLDLRLDPKGPAAAALGVTLPTHACTSARSGDVDVLWLGPDEWLVVGPPGAAERLAGQLRPAAGSEHVSVVDVSAQRTTLLLSGPRVRDLLALGCAIDLHPRSFGPGDCVQTELAHAPVVLFRRDPGFLIFVRASFAAHLADWLVDASVEYTGIPT
ncbi:sarcosine oxidase subunit gamma [Paractinoplanes globisporus]|uniref:Sarcosine oxidase subunit gamma n=1 Tax=Paractinoplanes globisporus TaxID=113565 RepID=A0ABW6W548_9ACTN|nr:sarcosine oxidase subunit gamma family protein [Actinoplanes globisporus]